MIGSSGLRFEAFKVSDGSPCCFLQQFRLSKDVSKKWPSQSMPPTSITQEGDTALVFTTLFEKNIFWEEHFDQAFHFKTALLMVEIWKNQSPGSRATLLLHTSLLPLDAVVPYKQLPPRSVWRSRGTAPAPEPGSHGFQELGYGAQQPFWTALLLMEKIQRSPVEVGPLSHDFQGFYTDPRWLFKISESSTILIVGNNQTTWPSLKSPLQLEHWTLRVVNISIKGHSFPKHLRNATLILLDSWCHRFLVWA